jgi:hypothetical protein
MESNTSCHADLMADAFKKIEKSCNNFESSSFWTLKFPSLNEICDQHKLASGYKDATYLVLLHHNLKEKKWKDQTSACVFYFLYF